VNLKKIFYTFYINNNMSTTNANCYKDCSESKSTKHNISTNINIKLVKLLYTLQNTSKYSS
jgi:hypothetical protein